PYTPLFRSIPGKGNQETQLAPAPRVFERAAEAVQNAAQARCFPMFFQQVQAIAPSIAAMDDDGKFCLGRQLHLVPEDFVLCFTRRMIVKIVQPDLAPGDYLGMPSKIPQPLEVFRLRLDRKSVV